MPGAFDPAALLKKHGPKLLTYIDAEECERDLATFFRRSWPQYVAAKYMHNWHIDAVCFPADTIITTEAGPQRIGDIVECGWQGRVLSYDHLTGIVEWRPIVSRMKSAAHEAARITTDDGSSFVATVNHPVFVVGRGYVPADAVAEGDEVLCSVHGAYPVQVLARDQDLPRVPHGAEGRGAGREHEAMPALWGAVLQEPRGHEARRSLLQSQMLRRSEGDARTLAVRVREREVERQSLPKMLGCFAAKWRDSAVSSVWRRRLPKRRKLGRVLANLWRLLLARLLRPLYAWAEQSDVYRRFQPAGLSIRVSSHSALHHEARWASVLPLYDDGQDGCASHRSRPQEQRAIEPRDALPAMPCKAAGADDVPNYRIGRSVVASVAHGIRLSEPVYNLEVEGHHNYFAAGVLVHNCDHLMACVDGGIRRLLINLPPRCSKTSICTIAFPAWVWSLKADPEFPLYGATAEFLCIAYNTIRAQEDAVTSRRLLGSPWYQARWGDRVKIALDRDNSERFDTVAGGARISTGINATVLGRGGNIKIIDDAMKPDEPESEQVRQSIIRSYDETLSNRENDPRIACEIVIAQRLGELDLPGHVLTKYGSDPDRGGFVHLCIPAEYESERHCVTVLGWNDPRGCDRDGDPLAPALRRLRDGTSFWPKRFPPEVLQQRKTAEGPFSYAAKYQQAPVPRGGGIIKSEWWQLWEDDTFPDFRLVLVSVDTAHTAKEQNDESGVTVWGVFDFGEKNSWPQVMLLNAWEGRLEFNRLVEKVAELCKKHSADVCLIEGEANGIDVISEIRRRYGKREWATVQFDPKGDKAARLLAVQPLFSGEYRIDPKTERGARGIGDWSKGVVWAPDKDYAQLVIDRVGAFTGGRQKALALIDTTSQALTWLRRNSHLLTKEEHQDDLDEELEFQKPVKPLYDV